MDIFTWRRTLRLTFFVAVGAVSYATHAGASYNLNLLHARLEERLATGMIVTLWGELFKIVLNLAQSLATGVSPLNRDCLIFWLPAAMYVVVNAANVALASRIDPGTLQTLLNMKIIPTALLNVLWLRKRLPIHQAVGLVVLLAGSLLVTSCQVSSNAGSIPTVLAVLLFCCMSALAGVVCEKRMDMLPTTSTSQINTAMALFSILCSVPVLITMPHLLQTPPLNLGTFVMWPAQSISALLLVVSQSTVGVIVGYLIRHEGNIGRLFLTSAAAVVATMVSMVVFHLPHCWLFAFGSGLVLSATDSYVTEQLRVWVAMARTAGWCSLACVTWWAGSHYAE